MKGKDGREEREKQTELKSLATISSVARLCFTLNYQMINDNKPKKQEEE